MPEITPYLMAAFEDELEKQAFNPRALLRPVGGAMRSVGGTLSRFGKRQAHSMTGWVPKGSSRTQAIREMGAGATPAIKRLEEAQKAYSAGGGKKALKELTSAQKHLSAAKDVESLGATSLPGYVKSLAKNPVRTLKSGAQEAWHGSGTGVSGALGKAGLVGAPAAAVASEAARPEKPGERSREERVGRALGGLAFGMTTMPITGATALGTGITAGAGLLGRGADKAQKTLGRLSEK